MRTVGGVVSRMTLTLAVLVYTLNYFGLRFVVWTSGVVAVCAVVPLVVGL